MSIPKLRFHKEFYHDKDFYIGIFSALLGISLNWYPQKAVADNGIYPHFVFQLFIWLGLFMILKSVFYSAKNSLSDLRFSPLELMLVVIIALAMPLSRFLGMYTAIGLVCLLTNLLALGDFSRETVVKVLFYNAVLIGTMYVVFSILLRIIIPKGLLI